MEFATTSARPSMKSTTKFKPLSQVSNQWCFRARRRDGCFLATREFHEALHLHARTTLRLGSGWRTRSETTKAHWEKSWVSQVRRASAPDGECSTRLLKAQRTSTRSATHRSATILASRIRT